METEAYLGPEDGASHAAFRPGSRWLFYGPGGIAYVFRAYGLHDCLNAIAGPAGTPGCVLIRAIEPLRGVASMARRRGHRAPRHPSPRALAALASGPARLTQALGISLRDNGRDLRQWPLRIHAPAAGRAPRGRHEPPDRNHPVAGPSPQVLAPREPVRLEARALSASSCSPEVRRRGGRHGWHPCRPQRPRVAPGRARARAAVAAPIRRAYAGAVGSPAGRARRRRQDA